MIKTLIAGLTLGLLLVGCSVNYSPTDVAFNQTTNGSSKGTMRTDAQGLTTATTPTQDASGSAATDGGLAALGGIRDAVGKLMPDLSQKTTTSTTTTQVKEEVKPVPAVPVFLDPTLPAEEIAEPEGLEDVIPPQGTVEEVD